MAAPDAHANFAISTVATAPSPATSGTSLVVAAGEGTRFPAVSFNATVWPSGVQPTPANAEIVRVSNIATDTFTIARTQESSSARTIVVGDQIMASITKKTLTDIERVVLLDEVVRASAGTIALSSISGAYRKLQVELLLRSETVAVADVVYMRLNGDTGANYNYQTILGASTTVAGANSAAQTEAYVNHCPAASATANRFSVGTIEIPYYAGATHKQYMARGMDAYSTTSGTFVVGVFGGVWASTSAVTSITLVTNSGANFSIGSTATLYGIT